MRNCQTHPVVCLGDVLRELLEVVRVCDHPWGHTNRLAGDRYLLMKEEVRGRRLKQ